jgi:hypothetical protein
VGKRPGGPCSEGRKIFEEVKEGGREEERKGGREGGRYGFGNLDDETCSDAGIKVSVN